MSIAELYQWEQFYILQAEEMERTKNSASSPPVKKTPGPRTISRG